MKTLDETIAEMEAMEFIGLADALYYLKAYKEMVDSFTGIVVQYKEIFKMIIDEAENENVG